MTAVDPQPGDWVLIRAQVIEEHPNGRDVGVELYSKTDQYTAFVRRDLVVEIVPKPIPEEPDRGSVALVGGEAFQLNQGGMWMPAGDDYSLTWAGLHERGDVVVIHHA